MIEETRIHEIWDLGTMVGVLLITSSLDVCISVENLEHIETSKESDTLIRITISLLILHTKKNHCSDGCDRNKFLVLNIDCSVIDCSERDIELRS